MVKPIFVWHDCKTAVAIAATESKKKASTVDSSGDESSSDDEDLNVRRSLLTSHSNPSVRIGTVDEFRKKVPLQHSHVSTVQ